LTQITSPNGTVTYTYDNGDRLTDVWHKKNDNTVLEHFTYAYNNANHITRRTDTNGDVTTFGYDNADQLTSESRTGANSYSITYTYDGNGNRLTKVQGGVTTNYTYQTNSDRLASAGTKSYVYDNNGNCTEVKVSGVTTVTLTYDYENRVTGMTYTGGGSNSFQYNGLNLRTRKVDSAGTFHYVTDGVTPGSDVLKDGAAVYTPGVSERRGTTSKYFQGDHLGSTRAIANSSQTQTDTWIYDAFGRVMTRTGTSVAPFQFAGDWQYQADGDSSLMLLGNRYYDAEAGRFISLDPIQAGDNWYAYCDNNPLKWIDPLGLDMDSIRASLRQAIARGDWETVNIILKSLPAMTATALSRTLQPLWSSLQGQFGFLQKIKPQDLRCVQAVGRMQSILENRQIPYQVIQVNRGQNITLAMPGSGTVYSRTGYHCAIQIQGRVYDPITGPNGMSFKDWLRNAGLRASEISIRFERTFDD
jgi:RHS repeat-associated protein